jgi:type III secretion system low calcium response chaperone LcrH/SycD
MPAAAPDVDKLVAAMQRWADGKATLKEVHGYSDEELYAVARTAYAFFHQGKIAEARTLFQGLFAVNPRDPYFARALGVVEYAAGNAEGALSAYDVATKLDSNDPASYVGRAEVLLAMGQRARAAEDLKRAAGLPGDPRLIAKARALLDALGGKR